MKNLSGVKMQLSKEKIHCILVSTVVIFLAEKFPRL